MKKLKKFLAGAIALAMAMSMFTMTAFAAPNIDDSEKGSITIHKYIKDDTKTWPDSTGDALTMPDGAIPLGGVDFTIYKIVDKENLLKYYDGTTTTVKIPTEAQLKGLAGYDENACTKDANGKWILNTAGPYKDAELIGTITTSSEEGTKGVASKAGLDLGIYLVIETSSPSNVTTPADPFLVSIPMTVDNNSWLYDVHVYPKNATASSGEVQLAKVEKVAGSDTLVPLGGAKFQLQEYKDSTWTTITKTTDKYGGEHSVGATYNGMEGVLTSDEETGLVTVDNLSPGTYRFVEVDTVNGCILRDNAAWYFRILSSGELEWSRDISPTDGMTNAVYDVDFKIPGTLGAEAQDSAYPMLGGVPYAVNDKPDLEKEVVPKDKPRTIYETEEEGINNLYADDQYDKEANYSVGDEIPYKLTIQIPDYTRGSLSTFTVYDEPDNMIDNLESITVMATYDNGDGTKALFPLDVNAIRYGDGGFKIELADNLFYKEFIITYTATLTADAEITTENGNPNEAKLVYSNSYSGTGTNEITDRAIVYSGEIDVLKHIGDDKKSPLPGVKFDLYEEIVGKTQDDDVEDGKITVAGVEKTVVSKADAASAGLDDPDNTVYVQIKKDLTTDGNGKISVKGLSDGQYWLVETVTDKEYNLLEGPVKVPLTIDHEVQMSEASTWTLKEGTTNEYILEKNTITGTTFGKNSTLAKNEDGSLKNNTLQISKEVINRKGFTLPTTGGMGTFVFTFVGVAMMAAAVILFITSKKKEAK